MAAAEDYCPPIIGRYLLDMPGVKGDPRVDLGSFTLNFLITLMLLAAGEFALYDKLHLAYTFSYYYFCC